MLHSLSLQNFRSYKTKDFEFSPNTTLIVGPNTIGKTNIIESIFLISSGKSFKTDKDAQMLSLGKEVGRVKAKVDDLNLEVVLTNGYMSGVKSQYKKFLINGVARRRVDFAANLIAVLFSPADLDIIIGSPSLRRNLLDDVLEQTDRDYRIANIAYVKALRQRNALLEVVRETGQRSEKQFEYWDKLVIENGQILTEKREEFIEFVNKNIKDIFDFKLSYDRSEISRERLDQYSSAEIASAVTLVGPHRDDFVILMAKENDFYDVKSFGSRGQQRLAILQLKSLQIKFIEEKIGKKPLLLLDDIFSELDEGHINLILEKTGSEQTIITTTHKEFVPLKYLKDIKVIELEKL